MMKVYTKVLYLLILRKIFNQYVFKLQILYKACIKLLIGAQFLLIN